MTMDQSPTPRDASERKVLIDEAFKLAHELIDTNKEADFEDVMNDILHQIAEALGIGQLFAERLVDIKKMESNILRLENESIKIYYDPLTGIYNRRFFDENLSRLMNTLSRSGGSLCLMMIDIDFFKDYNDTYGHRAGDECLKKVAEILTNVTTRVDDFVVRYGGDEFAVVLPNADENGAQMIADKMLNAVRDSDILHEKSSLGSTITVSIGVTTGKVQPRHRADDFIQLADELLYKSKQTGRDKYTFAGI